MTGEVDTFFEIKILNLRNDRNIYLIHHAGKSLLFLRMSFDTFDDELTNMSNMFHNSSALTTIYVSDKFVTTKVSCGSEMSKDCTLLKGFIDYINNTDKTDKTYANYTTGYFTKLVGKNGEEKIGAAGKTLTTNNLVLDDGKDFVAYEKFAAKMFSIGISDSTTVIDTINAIANDKAEYYDLQGKRLNEPQKGINIVKRNGKTMKVIIK